MIDIKALTQDELNNEITALGLPKFRGKQIYSWLHKEGVSSFDEMTNISLSLRKELAEHYYIGMCAVEDKYVSKIDGTVKYLFRLFDGEYVETVVMK